MLATENHRRGSCQGRIKGGSCLKVEFLCITVCKYGYREGGSVKKFTSWFAHFLPFFLFEQLRSAMHKWWCCRFSKQKASADRDQIKRVRCRTVFLVHTMFCYFMNNFDLKKNIWVLLKPDLNLYFIIYPSMSQQFKWFSYRFSICAKKSQSHSNSVSLFWDFLLWDLNWNLMQQKPEFHLQIGIKELHTSTGK